jgi:hypothetical protein
MAFRVKRVGRGFIVTDRDIIYPIKPGWKAVLALYSPGIQESGIERLTIAFPKPGRFQGHFTDRCAAGLPFLHPQPLVQRCCNAHTPPMLVLRLCTRPGPAACPLAAAPYKCLPPPPPHTHTYALTLRVHHTSSQGFQRHPVHVCGQLLGSRPAHPQRRQRAGADAGGLHNTERCARGGPARGALK